MIREILRNCCWITDSARTCILGPFQRREFGSTFFKCVWGWTTFTRAKSSIVISKPWIFSSRRMMTFELEIWEWPKSFLILLISHIQWWALRSTFRLNCVRKSLTIISQMYGHWDVCCMKCALSDIHSMLSTKALWSSRSSEASIAPFLLLTLKPWRTL